MDSNGQKETGWKRGMNKAEIGERTTTPNEEQPQIWPHWNSSKRHEPGDKEWVRENESYKTETKKKEKTFCLWLVKVTGWPWIWKQKSNPSK